VAKWSEALIAKGLAFKLLSRSVLIVPNCGWTGNECDLLVIEKRMRIIDVEVKISRPDLKADAKKEKWWHYRPWSRRGEPRVPRQWPDKVWKHYYAMPKEIWDAKLLPTIPAASGVILVSLDDRYTGGLKVEFIRNAKPNRDAKPISPADAIDLARLTSLRLWTALTKEEACAPTSLPSPTS
jgi:hypothetical protein